MSHTPGDWSQNPTGDVGWWLIGTPDAPVAEVDTAFVDEAEAKANARLIAAAPYLLQAVRDTLLYMKEVAVDDNDDKIIIQQLTKAIRKATGRRAGGE